MIRLAPLAAVLLLAMCAVVVPLAGHAKPFRRQALAQQLAAAEDAVPAARVLELGNDLDEGLARLLAAIEIARVALIAHVLVAVEADMIMFICAGKEPASEGWTTVVPSFGFLKEGGNSASNNRTGSRVIRLGSVDYEPRTIRGDCGISRPDQRTSLCSLSTSVVDREPLAQICAKLPAELDKRPPVI